MFTQKYALGILLVTLLGSATLAYGLSTEFLFKFDSGSSPTGLTSNSTHIFVANSTKIEIFDLSGNSVDSFPPAATLYYDVAVNSTHIFVTRTNGSIELFDLSGNTDSTFTNALTTGAGIALNSTHIFVADTGSDRVDIFNLSGDRVDIVGNTELSNPTDVTIDSNGRIIVSDSGNTNIQIFDSSGNFLSSFGSAGTGDGQFNFPISLDVDSNNRIIVSGSVNRNVQIFDSSGNFLAKFGSAGTNDGEFTNPSSLTVDTSDRIIVSDANGASSRIQVFSYVTGSSTGGGNDEYKTAPTSGLDWKTRSQIVTDGFTINGNTFDITDNWHTDFEKKLIKTNSINEFKVKTFSQNNGLMVQELAFGIPRIGEYHNAEVLIEVWYNYDKSIKEVIIKQDTYIINETNLITTEQESCNGGTAMCYVTTFILFFNDRMEYDVVGIKAFDMSRRTMMPTYLNEGIVIFGDSTNQMAHEMIQGTEKHEGLIEVVQIEKYGSLWVAQNGRIFELVGNDFRLVSDVDTDPIPEYGLVQKRNHSHFGILMDNEVETAMKYFDSSEIQSSDKGFRVYEFPEISQREQLLQTLDWYN